jgi:hypothetical protein
MTSGYRKEVVDEAVATGTVENGTPCAGMVAAAGGYIQSYKVPEVVNPAIVRRTNSSADVDVAYADRRRERRPRSPRQTEQFELGDLEAATTVDEDPVDADR